jgi:transcription antitermination factor NusG
MGKARSLVNKLKRRRKNANPNRGFRQQDKIDRKDEVLADSPGAYKYLRGIQRRQDRNFGQQLQPSAEYKPGKEMLMLADIERTLTPDIQVTLAAGLVEASGVQPGDIVKVLTGDLKGKELEVLSVDSSTQITLEDDAALSAPEVGAALKLQISGTKTSHN